MARRRIDPTDRRFAGGIDMTQLGGNSAGPAYRAALQSMRQIDREVNAAADAGGMQQGGLLGVPAAQSGLLQVPAAGRGGLLDMDEASRMARSRAMGNSPDPFYRGEATGRSPDEYPGGGFFSRDEDYASGFAARGGAAEPREFRLNLQNAWRDTDELSADMLGRLVKGLRAVGDEKMAAELVEDVAPGKSVDWFVKFAEANPAYVVGERGQPALIRHAVENSAKTGYQQVFQAAGFDAIDTGRDVQKLGGQGIRLKSAAFDPALADRRNINFGIGAAGVGAGLLGSADDGAEAAPRQRYRTGQSF